MRIGMHVHTCHSPDSNLPLTAIMQAEEVGKLDGVAITDHNEIKGAEILQQIAAFPVIIGEEIMTEDGEITGYFLNERIEPGLPLLEAVAKIKEQRGLEAVPHPFDRLRSSALDKSCLNLILEDLDLVETFNSRNIFQHDNHRAQAFAEKAMLPGIAGSDALSKPENGAGYIEIETFKDARDFLAKVHNAIIIAKKSSIMVHVDTKAKKIMQRIVNK